MAQLKQPTTKKLCYAYYDGLLGIDLTRDASECARNRAADILNMVPDPSSGCPVKRRGWRKVGALTNPAITAFHNDLRDYDLIATKQTLYKAKNDNTGTTVETCHTFGNVATGVNIVPLQGEVYITGYNGFWKVSGDSYANVSVSAIDEYVPETIISRHQDGTGGTALEGVNALTFKRRVGFLSDNTPDMETKGNNATYRLYPESELTDHFVSIISVEVMQSDGTWKELTKGTDYTVNTEPFVKTYYTANKASTATSSTTDVGFTLSAARSQVVTGEDDVRCTLYEYDIQESTESGIINGMYNALWDKISNAKIAQVYGSVAMDRIFYVVDNNKIYYTEPYQPNFIPDDNYITVGNSAPIVGLHKKNGYMVVVTGDSTEYTIFMVQGKESTVTRTTVEATGGTTYSSETVNYFSAQAATSGTGAVATKSFATLIDDPLFLARTGIYGIQNNVLTSETVIANRSDMINARLCDEPNLESAVAVVYNGFYMLCVNKHVYLLDSRNTLRTYAGSTGYECYYLDNIDAVCWLAYEGHLFFGDSEGNWCKFNTDIDGTSAYCDNGTLAFRSDGSRYIEEGHDEAAIHSYYVTRQDSDDYPQYFKTLQKRGCVITLKPYDRTSVTAYYSKNGEPFVEYGSAQADIFNWEDIDFSRFTFSAATGAQDEYIRKKVKKYKRLQFMFENNVLFEPFGLIQFTKTYTMGNLAK